MAEVATTHLPGSAGKLAVMMCRIARGLSPFHSDDGMRAWREFIAEELDGRDGWGLAVENRGGRLRGVRAMRLQGGSRLRRSPARRIEATDTEMLPPFGRRTAREEERN